MQAKKSVKPKSVKEVVAAVKKRTRVPKQQVAEVAELPTQEELSKESWASIYDNVIIPFCTKYMRNDGTIPLLVDQTMMQSLVGIVTDTCRTRDDGWREYASELMCAAVILLSTPLRPAAPVKKPRNWPA